MVDASELSTLADDLRAAATTLKSDAADVTGVSDTARSTVSGLTAHWKGPLADRTIEVASGYLDATVNIDGHIDAIADTMRGLATRADQMASDIQTLENDGADATALHAKQEQWLDECLRFNTEVEQSVGSLRTLGARDLDLPRTPDLSGQIAEIIADGSGYEGLADLAEELIANGDADGLQYLADLLGLSLEGKSAQEIVDVLSGISIENGDSLTQTLLLASTTLPENALPYLLNRVSDSDVPLTQDQFAVLRDLLGDEGLSDWEKQLWDRLADEYPVALVDLVANGDYPIDNSYARPLADALTDLLTRDPGLLDDGFKLADGGDPDAGGIPEILRAIHVTGGDIGPIIESYAAHAVANVDPSGEVRGQLSDVGEAIGILDQVADDLGAEVSIDLSSLLTGSAVFAVGFIPVVGDVVDGGAVVLGSVEYPEGTDWAEEARENRKDFATAIDLLTAGNPDRDQILSDLGLLRDDGGVKLPDGNLVELAEAHPEYRPLLQYADDLADGIDSGRG